MSGIRNRSGAYQWPTDLDSQISSIWEVLNRVAEINPLTELRNGLDSNPRSAALESARIIFGFDTSAIYRIGLNGTEGANAVDYIRSTDGPPIIVPGQTIQEVWNNQLAGAEPTAKKLRGQFDALRKAADTIDVSLGPTGQAAKEALDNFVDTHGDWIDPSSQAILRDTIEAITSRGIVSYVPRAEFIELARARKQTKTPPGFRDDGSNHGDFFVWADYLLGLARIGSGAGEAAVLVTNDVKSDWSRAGEAHPILVAEAQAVGSLPFRLWTVKEFQDYATQRST